MQDKWKTNAQSLERVRVDASRRNVFHDFASLMSMEYKTAR